MSIDWDRWSGAERWTHVQAACLTLGKDPDEVPESDLPELQAAAQRASIERYGGDASGYAPGREWYGPTPRPTERAKPLPKRLLKLSGRCNELWFAFPQSENPRAAAVMQWAGGGQQGIAPEFIRMAGDRLYLPARSLKALSTEIARREGTGEQGRLIALHRLKDAMHHGMSVSVHSVDDEADGACYFVLEEDAETCLLKHGMGWPFPPPDSATPKHLKLLPVLDAAYATSILPGFDLSVLQLHDHVEPAVRSGELKTRNKNRTLTVPSSLLRYEELYVYAWEWNDWLKRAYLAGEGGVFQLPDPRSEERASDPHIESEMPERLSNEVVSSVPPLPEVKSGQATDELASPLLSRFDPPALRTPLMAEAFGGIYKTAQQWRETLGDRNHAKWCQAACVSVGQKPTPHTWNPVILGAILIRDRGVLESDLNRAFQEQKSLGPWLARWSEEMLERKDSWS